MKQLLWAAALLTALFVITGKTETALAICETYEAPCGGNEDRTSDDHKNDDNYDGDRHDNDEKDADNF